MFTVRHTLLHLVAPSAFGGHAMETPTSAAPHIGMHERDATRLYRDPGARSRTRTYDPLINSQVL